ncbi:nuclear transport factor 2 family protein [Novosphingobium marinum]|uniref:Ketosteroid isomerase-like protein n=1 Tax=Novosphingobium marinum TaxID=1514948 RepID=A0A7Y9XT90_9SPHN|nr:nuclear transport factor 2 family protein [Novosphingobium marinum]NYH94067.1 ketosteroid isomerase-like protein [Novosphingobium marinum]
MDQAEMKVAVEQLYALSQAGDWDKVAEMVHDDLFITEAPGLPMEGVYRGKHALRDLFTKVFGMLEITSVDFVDTTYGEDWAVAILQMNFADGTSADLCEAFRFRDGKLAEIKPFYFDQAPVRAAAEASQKA